VPYDTLGTAREVGLTPYTQLYTASVGPTDINDFYRFRANGRTSINVVLSSLGSSNVNVSLSRDFNGDSTIDSTEVLISSSNPGNVLDSFNTVLDAGVYYLQVSGTETGSYNLGISGTSLQKNGVLWRNYRTGENAAWQFDGVTAKNGISLTPLQDFSWVQQATADFNGDGYSDIVWRNQVSGANVVWLINEQGFVGTLNLQPLDLSWQIAGAGDYNRDNNPDLFWRNSITGENAIWFLDGTNVRRTANLPVLSDLTWKMQASADFDNDGFSDLVWRNYTTGENQIWFMGANGTVRGTQNFTALNDLTWEIRGAGDFDGDGKADLFWTNSRSRENVLWLMDQTTILRNDITLPSLNADWQPLAPFTSVGPAPTYDLAGNLPTTALPIGTLSGVSTISESVGSGDIEDYYRFNVAQRSDVRLTLSGLRGDADLQLLDSNGAVITSSVVRGNGNELITTALLPGSYYARVYRVSGDTSYQLGLSASTTTPDLSALSFDAEEPLVAGRSFSVNTRVQNTGSGNAEGFRVGYYLSNDSNITTGDRLLGTATVASLAANSNAAFSTTLNLPASNDPFWSGNRPYYIGVIVDDTQQVVEANETNNSNRGEGFDADVVDITVNLPQLPVVTVTALDAAGAEVAAGNPGNPAEFSFTRTGDTSAGLIVPFTVSGTATGGTDFIALPTSVSFAAGQISVNLPVTILDDSEVEPAETLTLTLASGNNFLIGTTTATVFISDNDSAVPTLPNISISANDAIAAEVATGQPANPGQFTLTRTGDSTAALTVGYAVSGTATAGSDYTTLGGTAVFAAGSSTALLNVDVLDDTTVEPSETVVVTLTGGSAYSVTSLSAATVTVSDNDVPPTPVVNVTATDAAAAETAPGSAPNPGQFTFTRTGDTTAALTVAYGVAGGTATPGTDFTPLPGLVTFAAGASSATVDLVVVDDLTPELAETVTLSLSTAAGGPGGTGYTVGSLSSATVTITDNDTSPTPVIAIVASDPNAAELPIGVGAPANPGQFTLSRAGGDATTSLTVTYNVGGTATAGVDYSVLSGTATFAAGATTTTLDVSVLDDTMAEPTETVTVTLTGGPSYQLSPSNTAGTVTITDNDTAALGVISVSVGDAVAAETAAGTLTNSGLYTISRTGDTTTQLVVNYTLSGTATPNDLTAPLPGSVTIAAGATTADILVNVADDSLLEGSETLILTITAPANYTLGSTSSGTVTILDNEPVSPNAPTVSLRVEDGNAAEVSTGTPNPGSFVVSRDGDTSTALVVNYGLTGTATPQDDYTGLTGQVTIAAGQSTATLPVTVVDDTLEEPTETLTVTLGASGLYNISTLSTGTIDITDNDLPPSTLPVLSLVAQDDIAAETVTGASANPGEFVISRSGPTTSSLTVAYSVGGTATSAVDYTALGGTATFAAGSATASVLVNVLDDALVEGNETVSLTLGSAASYQLSSLSSATVTVSDNDSAVALPVITVEPFDLSVAEPNDPGSFEFTRTGPTTAPLTVSFALAGTATNGTDYQTISAATVTFAAGQDTALLPINVIDDTTSDPAETVTIQLVSGTGYQLGTTGITGTLTIVDDENPNAPPVISITGTDLTAAETATGAPADGGLITFTRSGNTATGLTVNYAVGGTATNGTDYTQIPTSISFAPGSATATLPIAVLDDTTAEANETITINLASGTGYTLDTALTATTITVSDNEVAPALPTVTILATDATATEVVTGGVLDDGLYTLTRTGDTTAALTVNYTVSGTATSGTDFTALPGSVSFAAGSSTATIPLTVLDDTTLDANETVVVTLASGATYQVGTENAATVAIADNELAPTPGAPTLSFSNRRDTAEGSTSTGRLIVSLPAGFSTPGDVVVNYTVSGTATSGTDYTALSGTLTLNPTTRPSANITVTALRDAVADPNETVIITFTPSAGYNLPTISSFTIVIADAPAP
jgi:CARDB/Bacterial pre-peptidase C-terminal domain/Calx-beta domain/FG-GAP-like repeat